MCYSIAAPLSCYCACAVTLKLPGTNVRCMTRKNVTFFANSHEAVRVWLHGQLVDFVQNSADVCNTQSHWCVVPFRIYKYCKNNTLSNLTLILHVHALDGEGYLIIVHKSAIVPRQTTQLSTEACAEQPWNFLKKVKFTVSCTVYKIHTSHTVMISAFYLAQVHVCVIVVFVHFSVDGRMR